MLQIKTIKNQFANACGFDADVNAALADGWKLLKREVIIPKAQTESMHDTIMLYAELEKEIITEAERNCDNCRYCDSDITDEPCKSCKADANLWEAEDS